MQCLNRNVLGCIIILVIIIILVFIIIITSLRATNQI